MPPAPAWTHPSLPWLSSLGSARPCHLLLQPRTKDDPSRRAANSRVLPRPAIRRRGADLLCRRCSAAPQLAAYAKLAPTPSRTLHCPGALLTPFLSCEPLTNRARTGARSPRTASPKDKNLTTAHLLPLSPPFSPFGQVLAKDKLHNNPWAQDLHRRRRPCSAAADRQPAVSDHHQLERQPDGSNVQENTREQEHEDLNCGEPEFEEDQQQGKPPLIILTLWLRMNYMHNL
ncbi:hypothetical protein EJB05_49381, partial [Eragrostis curvula]